jgi:hypothetical protein
MYAHLIEDLGELTLPIPVDPASHSGDIRPRVPAYPAT